MNQTLQGQLQAVGYQALVERYHLKVLPHFRESYVTTRGQRHKDTLNGITYYVYPKSYLPDDTLVGQLEFALKYDGVNLEILKATFQVCRIIELEDYLRAHPTGKYMRRLWFLYEYLFDKHLSIPDLTKGNYIDLLDPGKYFTATSVKSARHRVNNNLLGNQDFSP
ncbi:cell filamentation protein Fic, partial [Beggiatoa alba]|nr:cell filamentation protein Fic [Beggiatoa alba]